MLPPRTPLAAAAQRVEEENPAPKAAFVQDLEMTAGKL